MRDFKIRRIKVIRIKNVKKNLTVDPSFPPIICENFLFYELSNEFFMLYLEISFPNLIFF